MLPSFRLAGRGLPRPRLILLALCAPLLFASCGGARGGGHERRYDLKGKVVSVERAKKSVVVDHEPVPGLMEAMEMAFTLRDEAALEYVAPGDEIQATLVVGDEGFWLENPVVSRAAPGAGAAAAESAEPSAGAEVPDFSLVNQDGRGIKLRDYRGRALLLTFVYTRCPLPEYCTLMSTNFAEIAREVARDEGLRGKARLLSVTIDPARDTPQVLRSYGAAHTGRYSEEKFETWEFATGKPEEVRRLAQFFGLSYKEEGDQIVHSLRTALVAPDGRVYKIYRHNEWKPAEVLSDLRTLLAHQPHGD